MENNLKKNRYMYLYNWITLLYTWNVINLLLQLKKKLRFSNFEELVKNEIYSKNKYSLKNIYALCVHAKTLQLCPALCDPMDCSLPNSSVRGILQARILEQVAIPFSRGSSRPRNQTQVSCTAGQFSTVWATREATNFGVICCAARAGTRVKQVRTPTLKMNASLTLCPGFLICLTLVPILCLYLVAMSCLTLCNPMDCNPPGSSVRGILQARILEWVVVPFSRGSSQPRDQIGSPALQADSLLSDPPGRSATYRSPKVLWMHSESDRTCSL